MRKSVLVVGILFLVLSMVACASVKKEVGINKTASEIDRNVIETMNIFNSQVSGGREIISKAKAILIMPNVTKAGFVAGGQYGEGALRVGNKTVGYYNLIAGSYGFTFGAERMDIVIAFMTDAALSDFQKLKGWEVGIDGNVALIDVGGGKRVDTTTLRDPIVGFVFDAKGLMVDVSLKGAKFTKIQK
ncbi:MAG TPA: YSC84-related protein [Syntrophorhabdaceae bacterium]|nr:YSC84-related protein [Syntrophorhabdaceae bacterium]